MHRENNNQTEVSAAGDFSSVDAKAQPGTPGEQPYADLQLSVTQLWRQVVPALMQGLDISFERLGRLEQAFAQLRAELENLKASLPPPRGRRRR